LPFCCLGKQLKRFSLSAAALHSYQRFPAAKNAADAVSDEARRNKACCDNVEQSSYILNREKNL
jgi:hypothetical protein